MPATKLQDFREQYPQYQDWSDEELSQALHKNYYSTIPLEQFQAQVGLAPPPPPPPEPTLWDRVKNKFGGGETKPADVLQDEKPSIIDEFDEPDRASTPEQMETLQNPYGAFMKQKVATDERKAQEEVGPRYRDLLFAGFDDYMANKDDARSFDAITDYRGAGEVAMGQAERRGASPGFMGVTADRLNKQGRAWRAKTGDKVAQDDILEEIGSERERLIGVLQQHIDSSAERRERSAQIKYSTSTQEMLESQGFLETMDELADDPLTIIMELGIRSAPNMIESMPLALVGSLAGPAGFAAGLGLGSGMVEYRAAYSEYLREAGVDMTNARSMFDAAENGDLMNAANNYALTRSSIIAAVDTFTGHLATKTFGPVVKTAVGKELMNVAIQAGIQATGGAVGELGAQAATLEEGESLRWGEIVAESAGELVSAPIEVGGATVTGLRARTEQARVAKIESEMEQMLGRNQQAAPDVPQETPEPDVTTEPQGPEITPEDAGPAETVIRYNNQNWRVLVGNVSDTGRVVTVFHPDGETSTVVDLKPGESLTQAVEIVEAAYADEAIERDDAEVQTGEFLDDFAEQEAGKPISRSQITGEMQEAMKQLREQFPDADFLGPENEQIAEMIDNAEMDGMFNMLTDWFDLTDEEQIAMEAILATIESERGFSEGELIEPDYIADHLAMQDQIDELQANIEGFDEDGTFIESDEVQARIESLRARQQANRGEIEKLGVDFEKLGKGGDESQDIDYRRDEDRTIEGELAPTWTEFEWNGITYRTRQEGGAIQVEAKDPSGWTKTSSGNVRAEAQRQLTGPEPGPPMTADFAVSQLVSNMTNDQAAEILKGLKVIRDDGVEGTFVNVNFRPMIDPVGRDPTANFSKPSGRWSLAPGQQAELDEIMGRDIIEPEPGDPVVQPKAPVDDSPGLIDNRLKRAQFRAELEMMSAELTPGGGVTYTRDENDVIIGRTPSVNPEWFQALAAEPDTKVSVKQLQNAVNKAIAGKKLGVRQARVVQGMLDAITGRREGEELNYARQMLEDARARRQASQDAQGGPIDPQADIRGEMFYEDEYDPEMSADSRIIFELMSEAQALGLSEDQLERLAIQYEDNQELMNELTRVINEYRQQAGAQAPETEPAGGAGAQQEIAGPTGTVKRKKLTKIQQEVYDRALTLGDTFSYDELAEGGTQGTGKIGQTGQDLGAGRMSVNTLTQLMDKGYLESTSQLEGARIFDGQFRVVRELTEAYLVEARSRHYDDKQLELYLDSEPVESQAGAPRLRQAKADAVDALANLRSTPSVLARGLSSEFAQNQRVSLVGQKAETVLDLAALVQVYRDPRFETLRMFFVTGGEERTIVAQVGITGRMPASAAGLIGQDMNVYLDELATRARAEGALGYYMLHNHPSGQSMPSQADEGLTRTYAHRLKDKLHFYGHIVINHNNWSEIDELGNSFYHEALDFNAKNFKPTGGLAGLHITGPKDIIAAFQGIDIDEDAVILVAVNQRHEVMNVSTLPSNAITSNRRSTIRNVQKAAMQTIGAGRVFALSRNATKLRKLTGLVVDALAILDDGKIESLASQGIVRSGADLFPSMRPARVTSDTSPAFDYLRPFSMQERTAGIDFNFEIKKLQEPGDLFGDDVSKQQAIQDEIKRRDRKRNSGQESIETGDPTDLFSDASKQTDIEDLIRRDEQKVESRRGRYEQDETRGARLRNMPMEDLVNAVYTDPLTGVGNLKAYQEEAKFLPVHAVIDADSLKWINDNMGLDAGDAMLVAIAEALDQDGVEVYRIGGDEFIVAGESESEVRASLTLAEGVLANQAIESVRGRSAGIRITWGVGQNKAQADQIMKAKKNAKEARGERAKRGEAPPNTTLSVKGAKPIDMESGTNYVGMIGKHGRLPITPNNNLILGNGRAVRIPKKPVRREHILAVMRKYFGNRIYEGRVKGKMRLGFYRPGHGEIRLKNANDIEVAAHEVAHFLDDRYPWVRRLYMQHKEEVKSVSYDVTKVFEGYAEFMRLFFTQESFAMERTPSFYDAWRQELKNHPTLEAMVYDLQELMHAWTMQGARARGASKMGSADASIYEKMLSRFPVSFWQAGLDGLRSIKQIELDLDPTGTQVAYEKLRIALGGSNGVIEAAMFFGTPGWREDGQGIEFTGQSLSGIFGDLWADHDMGMYMLARRAQELSTQGRENLMRPDEIAAWLSYEQDHPEARSIFDEYQLFNDRMLDFAQGAGILNAQTREAMQRMNQNYVPFFRVIESRINGTGVKQGGNPFQRLKGGTQNVAVIWDNIIQGMGLIVRMSMINDGKRAILSKLGGTDALGAGTRNQQAGLYAAPIGTDTRPVGITGDQVLRAAIEAMGWSMAEYRMAKQGFIQNEDDVAKLEMVESMEAGLPEFVTFFEMGQDPSGFVDYYLQNGKKKWFEIIDPSLWDSLQFLGPKGTNLVLQVLGGFSATLRRGVVAWPTFQTKNFVRDSLNAWLLSTNIKVPAARALRVVFSRMAKDPAYQEMIVNGGGFANRSQGIENQRKMIINPMSALAAYDRFMGRFENANRLAEFKAARAAGSGPRRASLMSREISTDFAMRGSHQAARFLAISVPFLNARMQGNYRVKRQFDYRQMAISYAMRGGAMMAATLALYSLNKDDDRYREMPEDIKDLYWVIFTGAGEDDYMLLPKPFESGMIFGTIPERTMELTETGDGKEFADALGWMFLQTFAMDMTPQVFQPMIDLQRNKDFTGAPIIPFYLENVEPSEQFTYYTSETMKEAGRALGMSPMKMDYATRGYLGTVGTYLLAASDAMIRAATDPYMDPVTGEEFEGGEYGEPPTRGETWRENIVVKGLVDWTVSEGPPRRTKYVTDLYDMVREAEKVANTMALMQRRQTERAEEYISNPENVFYKLLVQRASPEDVGQPPLAGVRQKLSEVRTAMDQVRMNRRMTGDEKRVELWNLTRDRNELARQVMEAVKKAEQELEAGMTEPQAAARSVGIAVANAPPPTTGQPQQASNAQ